MVIFMDFMDVYINRSFYQCATALKSMKPCQDTNEECMQ